MTRVVRLILENVCYHVITRGNQRQSVFCEEIDFLKYLDLLKRYKKKKIIKSGTVLPKVLLKKLKIKKIDFLRKMV